MIENVEYFAIFLVFAVLAVAVFFLISQQKALQLVERRFRFLKPGLVWLQLIPLFGWVWMFLVVKKIAQSIQSHLQFENEDSIVTSPVPSSLRSHYRTGIIYCTLTAASMFLGVLPSVGIYSDVIRSIQVILNVIGVSSWIAYWVQLEKYIKILKLGSPVSTSAQQKSPDRNPGRI